MKNNLGMKLKGIKLLLLIPVGTFLLCVFFDIGNDYYWQKKLDKFVEENLISSMNIESIDTEEEYENFFYEKFDDSNMELYSLDVMIVGTLTNTDNSSDSEDYAIYVTARIKHFSISGYITNKEKYTTTFLKGVFDDYNEPIVEEYDEEETEDDKVYTDEELKEMEERTSESVAS